MFGNEGKGDVKYLTAAQMGRKVTHQWLHVWSRRGPDTQKSVCIFHYQSLPFDGCHITGFRRLCNVPFCPFESGIGLRRAEPESTLSLSTQTCYTRVLRCFPFFFAELSLLDGLQLPVVQLSRLHLLMFSVHASLLVFFFFLFFPD